MGRRSGGIRIYKRRRIKATILIAILLGSMLGFAPLHGLGQGEKIVFQDIDEYDYSDVEEPMPESIPELISPKGGGGRGGGGVPRDSDGDGYSDTDETLAATDPYDPCDPDPECDACLFLSYVLLDYPIENVTFGNPLSITGTATHRADGFPIYISVSGPTEFPTQTALLINGTFSTTFDTTGAEEGEYLVMADDLYGSTDQATVFLTEREAKTWYVDDDGGADFTNIQDAIDAASGEDIIYVYNGTYNGNLYIWKSITLQGENPKETFVKLIQNNSSDIVVAGTENVIVSGFTMISNKSLFNPEETHLGGVELYHVNNCTIINNIVSDFWGGIGGSELSFCNFTGNDISNNSYGIYVWNCSYNKIADNRVYLNGKGIAICGWSCNNTVTNNSIFLNGLGASTGNYCDFNRIYHNDFVENDEQAYNWNLRTNFWDNGYPSGGNYWSDHNCTGNPSNGSQPYIIDKGSIDHYPFEDPNGWLLGKNIFDTCAPSNPYPSIMGNHTGSIKPNHTVIATKLYTYPCSGTGGHTEYAEIWNATWNATATWKGYAGDWHNITFDKTVVLLANEEYNYTIRIGSYPQIHHNRTLLTENGWINCTEFTDANGKVYDDWILAIKLW